MVSAIVTRQMDGKVVIRDLEWEDFSQLVKGYYSFFEEVKQNPNVGIHLGNRKPSLAEEAKWFSSLYIDILNGDAVASIAEVGGKVVGICSIGKRDRRDELKHVGTLGIWITQGNRGRGIGTKLVNSCLKSAKSKFEIVDLTVFSKNKNAMRLYQRFGFKKYGFAKKAVKRGKLYMDKYLMSREL